MAIISSEKGSTSWKHQRLTAVILMLSLLFFTCALFVGHASTYSEITQWLRKPYIAALLILSLCTLFYHSFLGLKMIIEDYVHQRQLRQAVLFVIFILHIFFAILGSFLVILL
ncbi:MAG: succinate dehydrogenase, hydrophobic membrane anchor protein [Alphaproteobacteria bacterium]|nr:succinate dehydrogenase, hydrophobic membrane anchor protein [Alphaproteobacteria bacterium]